MNLFHIKMTSSESTVTKERWREAVKRDWYASWGWCQPLSLILYIFLFPHIYNQSCIIGLKCLSVFLSIVLYWSRFQEGFSDMWFRWYSPYWRECVTVLGMYIFTLVWLIILLCQHNVSYWEYFTAAAMMVVFIWVWKGVACGVWVLQRWGNI